MTDWAIQVTAPERRVAGLYEAVSPADAQRAYQGLMKGTWPALTEVSDWTKA